MRCFDRKDFSRLVDFEMHIPYEKIYSEKSFKFDKLFILKLIFPFYFLFTIICYYHLLKLQERN